MYRFNLKFYNFNPMQSIIMHLDMNSYFASVEQQDNPAWRGQPVGVCEHLGGIIIGASVEAKKWGIKTGTPVWEAKKLYPKIILTQTHPDRYRFYTRKFVRVVSDYTDMVEKYSIDEVFADLTKVCNIRRPANQLVSRSADQLISLSAYQSADPFEEGVKIAQEIKKRFKIEVGDWLRCSVGIAGNKTLAKIASDLKKPDGLVIIGKTNPPGFSSQPSRLSSGSYLFGTPKFPSEILGTQIFGQSRLGREVNSSTSASSFKSPEGVLWVTKDDLFQQLELTDIPGIGRRQEKNLNELGIKTLKELRDCPKSRLVARFGNLAGHHLYNLGQLESTWKAGVHQEEDIKSMGHMYTLPTEYRKPEFFLPVLYKLCEMVGRRLRRQDLVGNVIYFFAHDNKWQGFGKSLKLGYFLQDGRDVFLECVRMLGKAPGIAGVKIVGVTVAGLQPYIHQLSLFGDEEQKRRLAAALDEINDKYGEFTIIRALQTSAGKVFRDSIGFGRVKEMT